jgi:hypothetical protein
VRALVGATGVMVAWVVVALASGADVTGITGVVGAPTVWGVDTASGVMGLAWATGRVLWGQKGGRH